MDNHQGFWPPVNVDMPTARPGGVNVVHSQYSNLSQFQNVDWTEFLNSVESIQSVTSHCGFFENSAEFVDPTFAEPSNIDNYGNVPYQASLHTAVASSAFLARNPGDASHQHLLPFPNPSAAAMDYKPTHDQLRAWSPRPPLGEYTNFHDFGAYNNAPLPGYSGAILNTLPTHRLDQLCQPGEHDGELPNGEQAVHGGSGNDLVLRRNESDIINNAESSDPCYAQLLYNCLVAVPDNTLSLREIYEWVAQHSQKAKDPGNRGWQNSVRHNLSMNAAFERVSQNTSSGNKTKGSLWRLTRQALCEGVISTTRFRKDPKRKSERRLVPAPNRQRSGAKGGQATRATRRREVQQSTPAAQSSLLLLPTGEPRHRELERRHPADATLYGLHAELSPPSPLPMPAPEPFSPPQLLRVPSQPPHHGLPSAPMVSPYLLNLDGTRPSLFPASATPRTPPAAQMPPTYHHGESPQSVKPPFYGPPIATTATMTNFDFLNLDYAPDPSFLDFNFDAAADADVAGSGNGNGNGVAELPMTMAPLAMMMPPTTTMTTPPATGWPGPTTPSPRTDASCYTDDGVPTLVSSTTSPDVAGFL